MQRIHCKPHIWAQPGREANPVWLQISKRLNAALQSPQSENVSNDAICWEKQLNRSTDSEFLREIISQLVVHQVCGAQWKIHDARLLEPSGFRIKKRISNFLLSAFAQSLFTKSNPTPAAFQLLFYLSSFSLFKLSAWSYSSSTSRTKSAVEMGKRIEKIAISATSLSREISAHYPRRSTSRCSPFIQLNISKKNLLKTRTWSIIQINFQWRPKMFCSLVKNRWRRRAS